MRRFTCRWLLSALAKCPREGSNTPHKHREKKPFPIRATQNPAHVMRQTPSGGRMMPACAASSTPGQTCPSRSRRASWRWWKRPRDGDAAGFEPTSSLSRSKGSSILNTATTDPAKPGSPVYTPVCTSDAEHEHGSTSAASEDAPELAAVVEAWPGFQLSGECHCRGWLGCCQSFGCCQHAPNRAANPAPRGHSRRAIHRPMDRSRSPDTATGPSHRQRSIKPDVASDAAPVSPHPTRREWRPNFVGDERRFFLVMSTSRSGRPVEPLARSRIDAK